MAFVDLTASEKIALQSFMDVYRPVMGQQARLLKQLSSMSDAWTGGVSAIFAKLADTDTIDTTSSLSGANVQTKLAVVTALTDFNTILTTYNTTAKRQAYISAAGLPNVI